MQLDYFSVKNIGKKRGHRETNREKECAEPRMLSDVSPGSLEQLEDAVTQSFGPLELGGEYCDAEQEQDCASWPRQRTDHASGNDKKHAEDKRQGTTRFIGESFPSMFGALHIASSITRT